MTSILLMLLLSIIGAQRLSRLPSCPASCVVCSEDAVICHRLAHIIDAPDSTQALLLTEGSISTVQPASLSDLSNITLIGLSHNRISVLGEESFRNLPFLHTLLLDHNLLTSQALQGGALTHLPHLEVLALGNNQISMIQAGWLEGTKALLSLKLEGNLLTRLDSGSFPLNDLRDLETLDLSDNLIDHLDRDSFRGLSGLRTLDLSRNRLSSAPAEAFSYLSWLTNLNLDLNSWNCSCQLLELSAFLANFIQQPDKALYNGRRMVCVSADNPAVTTVLELTEANCIPSNQNITVQIKAANSVTPQLYARDLAITAVVCFSGGVGLTLLAVLIWWSRRKKLKERNRKKEKEEGESAVANHDVNHRDGNGKRRDLSMPANSSQPGDREAAMLDPRIETHGDQFRSRAGKAGSHFRCPDCSAEGPRGAWLNPMRRDNGIDAGIEVEVEREKRRVRMMMEEERRRPGTRQPFLQQGILTREAAVTGNKPLLHGNSNYYTPAQREPVTQSSLRPETMPNYRTSREMNSYRTDMDGKNRGGHEILSCESCHKTYEHRPTEQTDRQGRFHTNLRDSAPFDGFPSQYRQSNRDRNVNYNQFDSERNGGLRREARNVTFDLESSTILEGGNLHKEGRGGKGEEEARTSRDKVRGGEGGSRKHKAQGQSSRLLRVKLNLNPLRRSKVHPKKKNEQGHAEKSSSKREKQVKKGKEKKRQDGKGRGEKAGRGSSSQKNKPSGEKMKKSAKTKGSTEEEKEEDDEGEEGGQKSKTSSKQKKAQESGQEGTEGDQGDNVHPEDSQHTPDDATNTTDQSDATRAAEGSTVGQQVGSPSNAQGPIIQGPGPIVQGPGPIVQGPGSFVQGPGPIVQGPGPIVQGPGSFVQGPGPIVQGPGPIVQGPGSFVQGPGPIVQGPGSFVQGLGPIVQGPGPIVQGPGSFVQGPGPIVQGPGVQHQGTSLVLQSGQLSSQHPFSLSAADRNRTTNLSLLGSASSQLTGSSLSLQGGNLPSNMALVANTMVPSNPVNTIAPNMAYGGLSALKPNAASSGDPESFSRQAALGLNPPATSLLANTMHTNPLLGGAMQPSPLHTSQPGVFASNLAANPAIHPTPVQSLSQNQPPPDTAPLAARLGPDPAQGAGLQSGEGLHQLAPQPPPALQTKDSVPFPTQAQGPLGGDGSSAPAPQAPGPVTEDNLSNNNSLIQPGVSVPGGSAANMTASMSAGGVATTDGSVRVSGGSMHAADASVSGVSAPSVSAAVAPSTGSVSAAATLVQQEYLSEEGGSSPKRKLRLVLPEKTSGRPPTALEKKIR